MKRLYIIKAGTTFPATLERFGDFDSWTAAALGPIDVELSVVRADENALLPAAENCAGVVITGSHAMVTDGLPWSLRLEEWMASLLQTGTPLFGICYGHQLLARAAGGRAGFHPQGKEIGTVDIRLLAECTDDPLFKSLPHTIYAHVTHDQTVLRLPPDAVRLAANPFDPHQAFRIGACAWGVQFHPEYSAGIMRSYIEQQSAELASAGKNVEQLLDGVRETPLSSGILAAFGRMVVQRLSPKVSS